MTAYEPPTYEYLGSLRELTLGMRTGTRLDKGFPATTPFDQLTLS